MNLKRIITTAIGLPIVILVLAFGNKYIVDAIIAIIATISMHEYIKCSSEKAKVISWISYLCTISIATIHIISEDMLINFVIFAIPIVLLILFMHVIVSNMKITFEDITYSFIGICYIVGFLVFLPLTYGIIGKVSGKILIWYIMLSAWGTDIFAYLIGKNFGKHKFSQISPNKTIEGCLAGLICAVIINLVYTYFINKFFEYEISYLAILVISSILSIAGQIGDFSASVIKRYFGVKDFSNLFPGHGGMLDRIDSIMFIAPVAYFLITNFIYGGV